MSKGNREAARVLIERGADVNLQSTENGAYKQGTTALHEAITSGDFDLVNLLIEHFAHVEIKNMRGETALDVAERDNMPDVVQALREAPVLQEKIRSERAEAKRLADMHERTTGKQALLQQQARARRLKPGGL
jgi:ankyrin repeat protein